MDKSNKLKYNIAKLYWNKYRDSSSPYYWDIEWEDLTDKDCRKECLEFAQDIMDLIRE